MAETMHSFQLTSAGSCFAATALGRFTVFSDPCASGLTFAPQALRPACPAVDPSVHRILTEDAFGVCAILPPLPAVAPATGATTMNRPQPASLPRDSE